MMRLEMVILKSNEQAAKTALRQLIDPSPARKAAVDKILLGLTDEDTFLAQLSEDVDGLGNVKAVGLGSWVTEDEANWLRDIRNDVPPGQRDRTYVRTFDDEVNLQGFWEWVATLTPPLYEKQAEETP